MENTKYIKLEIRAEDYPYIAQAFAYAVAFFSNDKVRNTKEENRKRAKKLAEVAGRVNGAKIEILWK
mgnify:FL=1|jgi:hypothetical protein|tara:strand:- start:397 stop:597 length:201 start_codon:yes stop_codon:yes gene_type:complete